MGNPMISVAQPHPPYRDGSASWHPLPPFVTCPAAVWHRRLPRAPCGCVAPASQAAKGIADIGMDTTAYAYVPSDCQKSRGRRGDSRDSVGRRWTGRGASGSLPAAPGGHGATEGGDLQDKGFGGAVDSAAAQRTNLQPKACRLHVVYPGCYCSNATSPKGRPSTGTDIIRFGGFNHWAESNRWISCTAFPAPCVVVRSCVRE